MGSRFRDSCPLDCKVYVGELGTDGSRHELEEAFGYYGPLRNVWVARNPPGFAFVMFQDPRDARDAARALNGKIICGRKVRVELSSGKTRREMAETNGRYGPPRDGRFSPPPRGRSPRRSPVPGRARGEPHHRYEEPYYRSGGGGGGGRDVPPRRAPRSRSRSRSLSPPPRNRGELHGNGHGRSRTPISPSRSRSLSKSPEPGRYR